MIDYLKIILARLIGAFMVLKGDAMPVPMYDEDTTIVVIETDGSKVDFVSCQNYIASEEAYNLVLSKIIVWVCSKNRFFWSSDLLGSQIKDASYSYYEEQKNKQ